MDLLTEKPLKIYTKYLAAAFGSALITSIYSLVDAAMVGQYHGPVGSAAMSILTPVWAILFSSGLFAGIGGSVLYSVTKGENKKEKNPNEFFSVALLFGAILSLIIWIIFFAFEDQMLVLFGADAELLPLCKQYFFWLKVSVPALVSTQIFAAFLRNDGSPALATWAVVGGGIFNIVGDYLFVFVFDMGIYGAGLASAAGNFISVLIMLTHFLMKKNTLKPVRVNNFFRKFKAVMATGFSAFISDIAIGVLGILFNNQIMRYLGTDALAVYGVIATLVVFVQCCAYAIGQASQPILSVNFGAKCYGRLKKILFYIIVSAGILGAIWTVLIMTIPKTFINIFMDSTESVLLIAPIIMIIYGISFIFIPFNISSTYYFQSTMKIACSNIISLGRGIVVSGILVILLPLLFGGQAIWWTMPITDFVIAVFAGVMMYKQMKKFETAAEPLG